MTRAMVGVVVKRAIQETIHDRARGELKAGRVQVIPWKTLPGPGAVYKCCICVYNINRSQDVRLSSRGGLGHDDRRAD